MVAHCPAPFPSLSTQKSCISSKRNDYCPPILLKKTKSRNMMVHSLSSSGKKLDPTNPPGDAYMFCDFLTHPQTYLFSNFKVAKIPDKFQLKFHGTLL